MMMMTTMMMMTMMMNGSSDSIDKIVKGNAEVYLLTVICRCMMRYAWNNSRRNFCFLQEGLEQQVCYQLRAP